MTPVGREHEAAEGRAAAAAVERERLDHAQARELAPRAALRVALPEVPHAQAHAHGAVERVGEAPVRGAVGGGGGGGAAGGGARGGHCESARGAVATVACAVGGEAAARVRTGNSSSKKGIKSAF